MPEFYIDGLFDINPKNSPLVVPSLSEVVRAFESKEALRLYVPSVVSVEAEDIAVALARESQDTLGVRKMAAKLVAFEFVCTVYRVKLSTPDDKVRFDFWIKRECAVGGWRRLLYARRLRFRVNAYSATIAPVSRIKLRIAKLFW